MKTILKKQKITNQGAEWRKMTIITFQLILCVLLLAMLFVDCVACIKLTRASPRNKDFVPKRDPYADYRDGKSGLYTTPKK